MYLQNEALAPPSGCGRVDGDPVVSRNSTTGYWLVSLRDWGPKFWPWLDAIGHGEYGRGWRGFDRLWAL
jgi:hypothetical protein